MKLRDIYLTLGYPVWVDSDSGYDDSDRYEDVQTLFEEQQDNLDREVEYITVDGAGELVISLAPRTWYAVLMDRDDNDWGAGSYDYDEAVSFAKSIDAEIIAVIEEGIDPICIEEITDF